MKVSGIYKITNIANNKSYIGSSINIHKRKISHLNTLRNKKHRNIKLQNAFNKYGEKCFIFSVVEIVENINDLIKTEQKYIDTIIPYYNIMPFADRREFSKETKLKLSLSHLGHKHSEDSKRKIGNASKGNKYRLGCKISESQKLAIKNAKIGKRGRRGVESPLFGRKRDREVIKKVVATKLKNKELKPKCFCGEFTVAKKLCKYHYKIDYRKKQKDASNII